MRVQPSVLWVVGRQASVLSRVVLAAVRHSNASLPRSSRTAAQPTLVAKFTLSAMLKPRLKPEWYAPGPTTTNSRGWCTTRTCGGWAQWGQGMAKCATLCSAVCSSNRHDAAGHVLHVVAAKDGGQLLPAMPCRRRTTGMAWLASSCGDTSSSCGAGQQGQVIRWRLSGGKKCRCELQPLHRRPTRACNTARSAEPTPLQARPSLPAHPPCAA